MESYKDRETFAPLDSYDYSFCRMLVLTALMTAEDVGQVSEHAGWLVNGRASA